MVTSQGSNSERWTTFYKRGDIQIRLQKSNRLERALKDGISWEVKLSQMYFVEIQS